MAKYNKTKISQNIVLECNSYVNNISLLHMIKLLFSIHVCSPSIDIT